MAKRGRPLKEDAKRNGIRFRLRDNEVEILNELSERTGQSKTALFISWLQKAYEQTSVPDGD